MEFKKYSSIENSFQEEFIRSIYDRGFDKIDYVVQEKVHGANLSIITNGQEVTMAKRTGLISKEENFYNAKSVLEKYQLKCKQLFEHLANDYELNSLTVFGEIFGGGYPHKRISINKEAKLVQHGIYYSPDNDFYAFDILINGKIYVDVETSNKLFGMFGFVYANTLFQGSLRDCLEYSNKFKTTIPAKLGLPELEGNICEGVVIRPIKPLFFNSGSRIMIKNKNEDWSENNNHINPEILNLLLHKNDQLSQEAEDLCRDVIKYISPNRLSNVISKIGEVNPKKNYGKLLGMFNKDILTDFLKEHKADYDGLEKHERKAINKFVSKHASQMVADYFKK